MMSISRKKYRTPTILILLIGVFLFNGIHLIRHQSITADESSFYNYAVRFLKGNPDRTNPRIDNSKMPVSVLNTVPRIIEQILSPGLKKNDFGDSDIFNGRYVTLILSVLTLLLVFIWARDLFGINAGLFAVFLLSWIPDFIANSTYITTDSYSVLMFLLTLYLLWLYFKKGSLKYFILFSVSIALSQLVKQSLIHLYFLTLLISLIYYLLNHKSFLLKKIPVNLLLFMFINWLVINAGHYFYHSTMHLGEYHFMSSLFQHVQNILPHHLIIPFPEPFITGLDQAKYYDSLGGGIDAVSSFGKVTILGNESTGGSFWYYYMVSIWYKTPIGIFLLLGCSIIYFFRKSITESSLLLLMFLIMPIVYFLTVFSFFYKTQCGIRHIIFIFPFICIFSSQIIFSLKHIQAKFILGLICIGLVISVSFYRNNMYSYTNEFIIDKTWAFEKVGAANLEFMQGGFYLKKFLQEHPDFQYAVKTKKSGNYIIGTDDYLDIFNRGKYTWIRAYKPYAHFNYNYLLIKVP